MLLGEIGSDLCCEEKLKQVEPDEDAILDRKGKEGIFEEMSFEKHQNEESEPFEYLGEELSICLKSQEVQRP